MICIVRHTCRTSRHIVGQWRLRSPAGGFGRLPLHLGRSLPALATHHRTCSTDAGEASVDQLQALATRIVNDRTLASKLALSPGSSALVAELVQSANSTDSSADDSGKSTLKDVAGRLLKEDVPLPSNRQMQLYFINNFLPFIGFGFFDNFIMLVVGDLVDAKLGVAFGISTLAAAAIGNTFSDVIGLWVSGFIETANAALGIPPSKLTNAQREDIRMRILKNTACIAGIVIGCIFGMCPLLYPTEWRFWESRAEIEERMENLEPNI